MEIPSGKQPHNYGKIHLFIAGYIHYFDWAIFNVANCKRLPRRVIFDYKQLLQSLAHPSLGKRTGGHSYRISGKSETSSCVHSMTVYLGCNLHVIYTQIIQIILGYYPVANWNLYPSWLMRKFCHQLGRLPNSQDALKDVAGNSVGKPLKPLVNHNFPIHR